MSKFNFKKEMKPLYNPPKGKFTMVEVPEMNFLMGDGAGDPNDNPQFQAITEALYGLAYTIKFKCKAMEKDFVVPPLQGLWWMENMEEFSQERKDEWLWTLMIAMPPWVTPEMVEESRQEVAQKKDLPALPQLRFEGYQEGLSVQIMYLGAYADEGPTIAAMHDFIAQEGYVTNGKHHEIYLGDPRRNPPEKLKTVIRQPVSPTFS
ncbi:MAG: GyrI-like domain-containing protein [Anaerolineales bacterium]|jgi:hypothetical protein